MLSSEVSRLATDLPVRVFPGVWKLISFLRLPSQDRFSSLPLLPLYPYLYLFIFYIFSYLLLKTMGCFSGCLMSASIQKLFCGIYSAFKCSFDEFVKGETGLPVLFLCHLRTSPEITHNSHEINRALRTIFPC